MDEKCKGRLVSRRYWKEREIEGLVEMRRESDGKRRRRVTRDVRVS